MHVLIKTPTDRHADIRGASIQGSKWSEKGKRRGVLFCLSVFTFVCVCLSTGYRAHLLTNFWVE